MQEEALWRKFWYSHVPLTKKLTASEEVKNFLIEKGRGRALEEGFVISLEHGAKPGGVDLEGLPQEPPAYHNLSQGLERGGGILSCLGLTCLGR